MKEILLNPPVAILSWYPNKRMVVGIRPHTKPCATAALLSPARIYTALTLLDNLGFPKPSSMEEGRQWTQNFELSNTRDSCKP